MVRDARKDPLAGYRDDLNSGDRDFVTWDDEGKGCPVVVGEVFKLRSCSVQVTHHKRQQRGRRWLWIAYFRRLKPDRVQLLATGKGDGHGYVNDPRAGLGSGEMVQEHDDAGEFIRLVEDPEPEAIPRDEVKNLPSSVAARHRFEEAKQETIRQNLSRSIASQVREVCSRSQRNGADITPELEEIQDALERANRKVQRAA